MMLAPALALLAPLLCASAPATEVEAGVRSEARVRGAQASSTSLQPSFDFEIDPSAAARLAWHAADLSLSYSPQLIVPTSGSSLVRLLHRVDLSLEGRTESGVRLFLTERASYGDADLSPVSQAQTDPTAPLQTLPATSITVHYLSSQTGAGLDAALSRHARFSLSAGWLVSGGIDRAAQQALPLQRGPLGELSLSVEATRLDTLQTRLDGSSALFTTGLRATVAGLEESWLRALAPSWSLSLGAGLGVTDVQGAAPSRLRWLPIGEAGLSYKPADRGGAVQAGLSVRAAPVIDRITGEAYERIDGRLAAGWAPRRDLLLSAQAGAGVVATGTQSGSTLALFQAAATYASGTDWALSLGVRAAHQALPTSFDEFGAFLGFAAQVKGRL
ncbi:MAG TPA: hypothetical protein VGK67_25410 [Myxococcales bacterium]|jgi:hypothetical protein